ncbi:hypothetical protein K1719_021426 [Acacia pycnantha]|nr:hypothetical protein K1719_021426 [Acacia pycnantha]
MDTSDWRTQLQPDSRQRIVNKIMETLKRHIPFSGQEGLDELRNIAQRFEEKIYTAATSQPDYLRKISLKMLTMETKSHNNMNNPMPSNPGGPSSQPTESGLLQPRVQNPAQSHPMPLPNQPQSRQQIRPQNIQNNIAPQSNLSSAANIGQTPMQNLAQNFNMQNMPGQNLVVGQQQPQNPQQYLYQQQQLLKQKFQHSHSLMQMQQQRQPQLQQNLLQPNQLQSDQQSVMQTSSVIWPFVMQNPSLSGLQQNQQSNNVQSSTQSMLQQQPQQNTSNLLPPQVQQQQPQFLQQQMMSQVQSQPAQIQQQLGLQQQPNSLQRDMQQRLQASGPLLQQQNLLDQQKQLYQSPGALPETSSTSLDSTAQTGQSNGGDWQEEVYQKIKIMKEKYLPELNEVYQKIAARLQQHDSLPQQPKSDQLNWLKMFKTMLERLLAFLQVPKAEILPGFKEKLGSYEKQIVNFLNANRPRKPLQPGQHPPPIHSIPQPQSQLSHENQINSQLQPTNNQGSVAAIPLNNISSLNSMSGVSTAQQSMMNPMQPGASLDSGQGSHLNSLQHVPARSLQQNTVSAPQQSNMNPISSQGGVNVIQPNLNSFQLSSSMLQHPQLKQQQEQQMLQAQLLKQQFQQRTLMQRLQILQQQQQQQLHQPAKQQLHLQMPQPHQLNDVNDMKMRQGMGVKPVVFQQHLSSGQQQAYALQQWKQGSPFAVSSPQLLQTASPQISQHSSLQIDQQNLPLHTKVGTPPQSANSPFVGPTPSPPLAPSPMPVDSEKPISGVSSISITNLGHQQTGGAAAPAQSLAIGTPGISASPLLAEFSSPDGAHVNALPFTSRKSTVTEQPIECLMNAVLRLDNTQQNPQQYLYQQQQLLKHKFQHSHSLMEMQLQQQQQQPQLQQNLLQPNQLQSDQQSVMQTSSIIRPFVMQTPSLSGLQQNQQSNNVQSSTQSMLQQHPLSVIRQQQNSMIHQQQASITQQPILPSQMQQLMGQQSNATNLQHSHLLGQQGGVGDMQQQQRLIGQQNNLAILQQLQQQQLIIHQNKLSNMHQQQLGSNVPGLRQQQQLLGPHSGNSGLQTTQHSAHMLQQQLKVPMQQRSQQNTSNLLPPQVQQQQPQVSQQQMMSQVQSQPTQIQQQLGLQQQPNSLQRDMQQRLQPSGPLLQQQNVLDQQKQLYQSPRALPETSSTRFLSPSSLLYLNIETLLCASPALQIMRTILESV